MKLNQQMLALGCMASMIPMMTGCEKEEQTSSASETVSYWVPVDSQGNFDKEQAEKNIKQIGFDKNLPLFQKLIDETSKAGGMTDTVWNRFAVAYEYNNPGSEQWIQKAKPLVRAVVENPKACSMIQDNRTDEAKKSKDGLLYGLAVALVIASAMAAKANCNDKKFKRGVVRYIGTPLALVGVFGSAYGLVMNQGDTVQRVAIKMQEATYQQTLQKVKQTIPQYLQENQRS